MTNEIKEYQSSIERFELIFTDGGSLVVQTPDFVHSYDDMGQAARDVFELMQGEDPSGWDGNEPEYMIDFASGDGCQCFAADEIPSDETTLTGLAKGAGGFAEGDFFAKLAKLFA